MLACLDVAYGDRRAVAACVLFEHWQAGTPATEVTRERAFPEPYESGRLYLRELPCLLDVLDAVPDLPGLVIVDGYVWLSSSGTPGLGGHLYDALGRAIPVVGVAKRPYSGAPAVPVLRGRSRVPLFVSAAGADASWAASRISAMHGPFRIPTLLKRVDRLARDTVSRG